MGGRGGEGRGGGGRSRGNNSYEGNRLEGGGGGEGGRGRRLRRGEGLLTSSPAGLRRVIVTDSPSSVEATPPSQVHTALSKPCFPPA